MMFDLDVFLEVLAKYHTSIYPIHFLFYLLGLVAAFIAFRGNRRFSRWVGFVLAFMWLWNGIVFSLVYWAPEQPIAYSFVVSMIPQGLFFAYLAWQDRLRFRFRNDAFAILGVLAVAYGLVIYPIVGALLGRVWPRVWHFGVVPCPVTVFTLGLLFWSTDDIPRWIYYIPVLNALATIIVVLFGVWEDIGVFTVGLVWLYRLIKTRRAPAVTVPTK